MSAKFAAVAVFLALGGCAAPSLLHVSLGSKAPPAAPPVVQVAPPSAAICQPIPKQPVRPANAIIPKGVTAEDILGFQVYLGWLSEAGTWAREGWSRVEAEQKRCPPASIPREAQ